MLLDIHFEPSEDELRIQPALTVHSSPDAAQIKRYQAALISRIKVMAGMNIAEKRLPQDEAVTSTSKSRARRLTSGFRRCRRSGGIGVSPVAGPRENFLRTRELGFAPDEDAAIRDIIVKPHGIFLVTGPTDRANPPRFTPFSRRSIPSPSASSPSRNRWSMS